MTFFGAFRGKRTAKEAVARLSQKRATSDFLFEEEPTELLPSSYRRDRKYLHLILFRDYESPVLFFSSQLLSSVTHILE